MSDHERGTVENEDRYHQYSGNVIPWYVHLLWILFWCFAAYYISTNLFPSLRMEMTAPP